MGRYRQGLLLALLVVPVLCSAQIVIHDTDLSGIGASYTKGLTDGAEFNTGSAGANQTWVFGDYAFSSTERTEIIAPLNGPHGSLFPTATRAMHSTSSHYPGLHAYSYERVAEDGVFWQGAEEGEDYTVADHETMTMLLPLEYQTAWTWMNQDTFEFIPGEQVISIDSGRCVVDGWGTLQTPYGIYPTLRSFTHWWTWWYTNGNLTDSWEWMGYTWTDQAGLDVASVLAPEGTTDPQFTSGSLTMITDPQATEPGRPTPVTAFWVGQNYPNPFNPTTVLPVTLRQTTLVSIDVFDVTGRRLSGSVLDLSPGTHNVPVEAAGWASGTYYVRVSSSVQQQTVKMQLVR